MIFQKQSLRQITAQTVRQKQMGGIKLAHFFSLPEDEFLKMIKEIEKGSLFQELMHKWRIIGYRKFTGVKPSPSTSINEQITSSPERVDLENLLYENPETMPVLRKIGAVIGRNRFDELLHKGANFGEIVRECKLTEQEKEIFKSFLDKFELEKIAGGVQDYSTSGNNLPFVKKMFPVASIEREGNKLVIYPYSEESYLIKGRYYINYNQFERLYREKKLIQKELTRVSKIFKMLDLINRRMSTIYQIIHHIKERQSDYLRSGNVNELKPLTRRELADRIGVHPSSITRVIANKSIFIPQKGEKPLEFFFLSPKEINKGYIRELIEKEKILLENKILSRPYSDEVIKNKLYENYHILVSRRTVVKYRRELNIPASNKRKINT